MMGTAGNKGEGVRSDCFITVELANSSGIDIRVESKVEAMYGNAIRKRCNEVLDFFEIRNARVHIEDQGALDFVLAARLEAALKQIAPSDKEYLLPFNDDPVPTPKDRLRRSRLYLPGNTPKLMLNAGIHGADGLILDLEDSVAPDKKDEARFLVRNALRTLDFGNAEKIVRINQLPLGLEDLKHVIMHGVNLILIPKCESAVNIKEVDQFITRHAPDSGPDIHLMPILESALGIVNAWEIASASDRVVALAIGLEDYTADLGIKRTVGGQESWFARASLVNAAAAAGVQAIDSVFSDVGDEEGLKESIERSRSMGFTGMGCIHPRQIALINQGFNPDKDEIEKAKQIVLAWEKATQNKQGVIALGSKMIDLPVAKRALRIIDAAVKTGLLDQNWREEHHD